MNNNIKAGADIHTGDGGYSEGTQEKYRAFVKNRNRMNDRIKEITGQVLDELVPETWTALGYDKIKEIQFRTAELIVRECIDIISPYTVRMSRTGEEYLHPIQEIKKHFGMEE
jgi:hypothetical protein